MNDLYYIFYEPARMALDTLDMTPWTDLAHRKLADFIWVSDRAPRNRDATLRQITHASEADWPAIKKELLEKGWVESGDLAVGQYLIHRGIIGALNESKLRYMNNFNRQCAMNNKPRLVASEPDPVTGIVNVPGMGGDKRNVTALAGGQRVTGSVTPHATPPQNGSEGKHGKDALLTAEGAPRLAGYILRNETGWYYDNCKVKPDLFLAKALVTELKPYHGRLSEKAVVASWDKAVATTHQAIVDGLTKTNPAGYCVNSWRKLMDAEAARLIAENGEGGK